MATFLSYLLRLTLCLLVMGGWYFGAWLFALPVTLWYVLRYPAYELCIIGALLDIQFYTGDFVPYYFFGAILLVTIFRAGGPLFRPQTRI